MPLLPSKGSTWSCWSSWKSWSARRTGKIVVFLSHHEHSRELSRSVLCRVILETLVQLDLLAQLVHRDLLEPKERKVLRETEELM